MSPPASPNTKPGTRGPGTFAAFGARNYRVFAAGFLGSSAGLQMLGLAVGYEVWERTRDPLHLGYVGVARALPVVLLALVAGQLADVFDRRKMLIFTQAGFAIGASLLAWASWAGAPLWTLYALLVLLGLCRAFNGPSRASLLPLLVPDAVFRNAVAWNANMFQISAIGGPILAGAVIVWTGAAWPVYLITAAGTLGLACAGLALRPREQVRAKGGVTLAGFFAGATHIWREKTIFGAIALDLFAVLLGGATALLPIYAEEILHVGPVGLGALRAAPFVGALLMGLALAHRSDFTRAGSALLWSVAWFGLFTIVFGFSQVFWLSLVALLGAGAADQISVVIRHVLVQLRTPDELRGRVSAVNSVFIECSNELGAFESGLVAKLFSPIVSVVSGGIGTILVVAGVAAGVPELRKLGALEEPAKPQTQPTPRPAPEPEATP